MVALDPGLAARSSGGCRRPAASCTSGPWTTRAGSAARAARRGRRDHQRPAPVRTGAYGLITQRPSEVPGGSPTPTFRTPRRVVARAASTTTSRVRPRASVLRPCHRRSRHWNSHRPRAPRTPCPAWAERSWNVQPLWRARCVASPDVDPARAPVALHREPGLARAAVEGGVEAHVHALPVPLPGMLARTPIASGEARRVADVHRGPEVGIAAPGRARPRASADE